MLSFDATPVAYLVLGYALLWTLALLAADPFPPPRVRNGSEPVPWWQGRTAFLLMAAGALGFMRLPVLLYNQEMNPDESQIIAQSMTLAVDPVFWRSVDGTTGGPLDSYLLLLPSLLGLPFDYITARFMGLLCIAVSLYFGFRTAEIWFSPTVARWALVPPLTLLAVTQHNDLVHYSSEHLPVALLSALYFMVAWLTTATLPRRRWLYMAGLLAGMVPFGKLQGVPMALVAVLFITFDLLRRRGLTIGRKTGRLSWLVAGGVTFPALVALLAFLTGVFDDFVTFYIIGNLNYGAGSGTDHLAHLLHLPVFLASVPEVYWLVLLVGALGVLALGAWAVRGFRSDMPPSVGAFLLLLLGAVFIAITRTGTEYIHYLLFAIGPLSLLGAWFMNGLVRTLTPVVSPPQFGLVLAAAVLVPYGVRYLNLYRNDQPLNLCVQSSRQMPKSEVTQLIRQYAAPGEPLVVWGWMCKYYVEAQMPQGVSENHSIRSAFGHPMRPLYQTRYLANLHHSDPPVFVDAVGHSLWMNDRPTMGHEAFPALKALIESRYRFVGEISKTRIYVRADRYKRLGQVATK